MVHAQLGDQLVFSSAVGFSHRDRENQTEQAALPGAKPVFFFAPDRLRKRAKDWGRDGIDARFGEQWRRFVPVVSRWLTVTHGNGAAAVEAVYMATLDGKVAPDQGHVLSLHETAS